MKENFKLRIEMPDFVERSVFESLVNGFVHRDYLIIGSEVHIDIYDNRLTIYSPGGMPDGGIIQNINIDNVPSTRRNPLLADIFSRLGYMERQGSGLGKIIAGYEKEENYSEDKKPSFYSDRGQFTVTLMNLNYKMADKMSDKMSDKVTDKVSDKVTDKMSDNMADKVTDKMSDKVSDKMSDKVSNKVNNKMELIKMFVSQNGETAMSEIVAYLEIPEPTARRIMAKLISSGKIKAFGNNKNRKYSIITD